jgi:hypothetical protein
MKLTKCTIATRDNVYNVKVIESAWLLYLIRFFGTLGVGYPLTVGTRAITLMWWIVAKPDIMFEDRHGRIEYTTTARHEFIHVVQQREGWGLGFLAQYVYWLIRRGYWKNPFELEAYKHQDELWYLMKRNKNDWRKYI